MSRRAEVETFPGNQSEIAMTVWPPAEPRHIVILAHGYGEHLGRYDHVADALGERGAASSPTTTSSSTTSTPSSGG